MEYILSTNNLTKKYGKKTVLNNLNIHIRKGDIYGFIGKNGAGKTTAMKLILGTSFATSGEVELFGSKDLNAQRRKIGSLIEAPSLYSNCTAIENMKRFSILYGGTDDDIKNLLDTVGLQDAGKKKVGKFSLGMKQRLGIAIALLGKPEFLILDEPINGLDPSGIKEVRDIIIRLNKEFGITFLISSHLLDELSKVVTMYGIINNGFLLEEVSAKELSSRCNNLKIVTDNTNAAKNIIENNFSINNIEVKDNALYLYSGLELSAEINKALVNNNISVYELAISSGGLENYFIERIGR